MTDIPLAASQHAATRLPPWVEPALRHGGWFAAFLVLAPVIGPRDYGLFVLALAGVAIAEAALAEPAATALAQMSELDEHHWSTALLNPDRHRRHAMAGVACGKRAARSVGRRTGI
jgi:hypothetical protein